MGTWYNVPIIKQLRIRTITPKECLSLQGLPATFDFPDIPIKHVNNANTVVVPVVRRIAKNIKIC